MKKEEKKVIIINDIDEIEENLIKEEKILIIISWKDIENDNDYENRPERIQEILKTWDEKLKGLFEKVNKNCGIIIASGNGDTGYAD